MGRYDGEDYSDEYYLKRARDDLSKTLKRWRTGVEKYLTGLSPTGMASFLETAGLLGDFRSFIWSSVRGKAPLELEVDGVYSARFNVSDGSDYAPQTVLGFRNPDFVISPDDWRFTGDDFLVVKEGKDSVVLKECDGEHYQLPPVQKVSGKVIVSSDGEVSSKKEIERIVKSEYGDKFSLMFYSINKKAEYRVDFKDLIDVSSGRVFEVRWNSFKGFDFYSLDGKRQLEFRYKGIVEGFPKKTHRAVVNNLESLANSVYCPFSKLRRVVDTEWDLLRKRR